MPRTDERKSYAASLVASVPAVAPNTTCSSIASPARAEHTTSSTAAKDSPSTNPKRWQAISSFCARRATHSRRSTRLRPADSQRHVWPARGATHSSGLPTSCGAGRSSLTIRSHTSRHYPWRRRRMIHPTRIRPHLFNLSKK